jgi:hypothetical protein
MPEAAVQPEDTRSLSAALAIRDAIEELGPEWSVRFEGPEGLETEYRHLPPTLEQIEAVVYVTATREAVRLSIEAIKRAAERWRQEKGRGGTVTLIVVEEGGERSHTIRIPEKPG